MSLHRFTPEARHAFFRIVGRYARELQSASKREARRHAMEIVGRQHVLAANRTLLSGRSRRSTRATGLSGGLLLGAATSQISGMLAAGHSTDSTVLWTVALAVAGTACVAHHIGGD